MASKSANTIPYEIRKAIGLVGQDAELFSGTVKENILMSRPTASDQDILAAAKLSGVEEFISGHPHGLRSARRRTRQPAFRRPTTEPSRLRAR